MKRKWLAVTLLASLVVSLAGCGAKEETSAQQGTSVESGDTYEKASLRLTNNGTDQAIDTKFANLIAQRVKEKTNGAVEIKVFSNDQLSGGNQSKGIEMLTQGTSDIAVYSNSITGSVLDERLLASSIPFTFKDYAEATAAYTGEGGKFVESALADKGLIYLGAAHNGLRQFSNSKRDIKSPEDMKNLKMRVMGSEIYLDIFSALGADPVAMSWSEVYTALQQGTIDGQDNGFITSSSTKMYEVQKHFTRINYTYDAFLVMAHSEKFAALPEKTQKMLQETITECAAEINAEVEAQEEEMIKEFSEKHGVTVTELTEEELQVFKTTLQPVIDKYKAQYGAEACAAFGIE